MKRAASSVVGAISKKPKPAAAASVAIPRDPIPEFTPAKGDIVVASYNVAGLRSWATKRHVTVEDRLELFQHADVICLQETKLQPAHESNFENLFGDAYVGSFSSSFGDRKGYAGTATFVKRDSGAALGTLTESRYDLGEGADLVDTTSKKHCMAKEGRSILSCFSSNFDILNLYVPNSGAKLERLGARVSKWDRSVEKFINDLHVPVLVIGDLNVCHKDVDIWNPHAPHIPKQAGCTVEERESFTEMLRNTRLDDMFRKIHGDVTGHYSYWSARAKGRPANKGLRLDYALVNEEKLKAEAHLEVVDVRVLVEVNSSDHGLMRVVLREVKK